MQNWQEYRNFKKTENADGSTTYIITVDGEDVEVSKEIYAAYSQGAYKMEYMECGLKRDRVKKDADGRAVKDANGCHITLPEREASLDKLIDDDWDFPSSEPTPEDAIFGQLEIKGLYESLDSLDADERRLIDELFFEGQTEREYAKILGISKTALHARKQKVLSKLKNLINP